MKHTTKFLRLYKCNPYRSFCTENRNEIKGQPRSHKIAIAKFFNENEELMSLKDHIPPQYLKLRRVDTPQNLFLISPSAAKIVASHVKAAVELNRNQVVAETNAGLGLIAAELLESGVKPVRLYETCSDFRQELKDFNTIYPGQVELFNKDIFHLYRYDFVDKQDHGNRTKQLLGNVPKRSWASEPVMTLVGSMPTLSFLNFLIKSLCLQNNIVSYGRFQIFAMMKPKHYAVLKATLQDNLRAYQYWTVLYNLLLDFELLEKIPRKLFLPWESPLSANRLKFYPTNLEPDKMYLVKINFKRELPMPVENLLQFLYFLKHIFGRGGNKVIPTVEKWVPECGLNILLPKESHSDYFENMNIFTQFRELSPHQILAVFKEMSSHPSFAGSSFVTMIENELLKLETIDTSLAETNQLEKNIEDIQQKFDTN